jgi:DNA-binding PadR family transcriptional regulator
VESVGQGLSELGRFSEPALLILISLAGGPKHGYAVMADVAAFSGNRLGPGTLYGAIARLERLGLIEPVPSADRRQPYRLTGAGGETLRSALADLKRVVAAGWRRLEAT